MTARAITWVVAQYQRDARLESRCSIMADQAPVKGQDAERLLHQPSAWAGGQTPGRPGCAPPTCTSMPTVAPWATTPLLKPWSTSALRTRGGVVQAIRSSRAIPAVFSWSAEAARTTTATTSPRTSTARRLFQPSTSLFRIFPAGIPPDRGRRVHALGIRAPTRLGSALLRSSPPHVQAQQVVDGLVGAVVAAPGRSSRQAQLRRRQVIRAAAVPLAARPALVEGSRSSSMSRIFIPALVAADRLGAPPCPPAVIAGLDRRPPLHWFTPSGTACARSPGYPEHGQARRPAVTPQIHLITQRQRRA